jgi:hypothetical protein
MRSPCVSEFIRPLCYFQKYALQYLYMLTDGVGSDIDY